MRRKILSVVLSLTIVFGGVILPDGINLLNIDNSSVQATDQASAELWEYELFKYNETIGIALTEYKGTQTDIYIPSRLTVGFDELSVLKLGDNLFNDNSEINSVTLAGGIKVIGNSAFAGATNLVCIVTNEDLEQIGANAFDGCTNFNSVILYDSVKEIGNNAFANCNKLTVYANSNSYAYTYANSNKLRIESLTETTSPTYYTVNGIEYYVCNGEATAVDYVDKAITDIEISPTIKGYPVRDIGDIFYSSEITSITLPNTITTLTDYAFLNCKKLTYVELPESITSCGYATFGMCTNLKNIELPKSVQNLSPCMFQGSGIEFIDIPNGVSDIADNTFDSCPNLKVIVVPESVQSIENLQVEECSGLMYLFKKESTIITDETFADDGMTNAKVINYTNSCVCEYTDETKTGITITVDENDIYRLYSIGGVVYEIIDDEAVVTRFNSPIESAVIPSEIDKYPVTSISEDFTSDMSGMYSMELVSIAIDSPYIKDLPDSFFDGCQELTSVTLNEGLETIGERAFSSCYNLSEIVLPDSIKSIGSYAFENCKSLSSITFPSNMKSISTGMFSGCTSITDIEIPETITNIGKNSFSGCTNLGSISIPTSIKSIYSPIFGDDEAFKSIYIDDISAWCNISFSESATSPYKSRNMYINNDLAENIVIPDGVTIIKNNCFNGCKGINSITIPESVTTLYNKSIDQSILMIVHKDSYAHRFAVENNLRYSVIEESEKDYEIIDGITYYFSDGKAIVTNCSADVGDAVVLSEVDGFSVTDIETAFKGSNIKSVVLPDTVTEIKEGAFQDCANLKKVTLGTGIEIINTNSFLNCKNLEEIEFKAGLKKICQNAFRNCNKLWHLDFPETLETIENTLFTSGKAQYAIIPTSVQTITLSPANCLFVYSGSPAHEFAKKQNSNYLTYYLINGDIENSLKKINGVVYYIANKEAHVVGYDTSITDVVIESEVDECPVTDLGIIFKSTGITSIVIPGSVKSIPDAAFENCKSLKHLTIMDGVSRIGANAFKNCWALEDIVIPDSVTQLGEGSFSECRAAKEIMIGNGVVNIPEWCFSICPNAEIITIGDSVSSIDEYAFSYSSALKKIIMSDKLRTIGEYSFYWSGIEKLDMAGVTSVGSHAFVRCMHLTEVNLPDIEVIGDYVFADCTRLEKVSLSDKLSTLGKSTFMYDSKLNNIKIPRNVTEIGDMVFIGCSSLDNITMPDEVTSIGRIAFGGCSSLSAINIPENVSNIAERAFDHCRKLKAVEVPDNVQSIGKDAFHDNTVLIVQEDSYAHNFARDKKLLYFVPSENNKNPEITYGAGVSGNVTYTDGTPAIKVKVEMLYEDGSLKETIKTDVDGNYSFNYAEVGRYTIKVTDDEGNTGSQQINIKRINVFDVFLTGTTDITLKKGWAVSGSVSPADAKITITDQNGNVIAETTAENGSYSIPNIPNGEYIVKAETDNGSAVKEINVFDSDLEVDDITIEKAAPIEVSGTVYAQSRQGENYTKTWAQVIIYNTNGTTVASTRTDENGLYNFGKLPAGEYYLVAETMELREDKAPLRFFERPYALRGYTYINVTDTKINGDTDIVMLEQSDKTVRFEGSVRTTEGRYMACDLTLYDIFKNELDKLSITNGRFYATIPEGIYRISAVTADGRTGYTTIGLFKGKPQGSANIIVSKSEKIAEHENILNSIPECKTYAEANEYRDTIISEKKFYDSLSRIEKNELSQAYVTKLNKLITLLSSYQYYWNRGGIRIFSVNDENDNNEITGNLENGGLIVSAEELEQNKEITLSVSAKEIAPTEIDKGGISTGAEYVQLAIEDAAGDMKIGPYYDISLVKTVGDNEQTISDIGKNTDTTGKLKITIPIPEEYKEHAQYKLIHVHNGETTTLADLGDDEDTITIETDKFSTFVLAYSDEKAISNAEPETFTVTLNTNEGTIADGENITGYTEGEEKELPTPTKEGYTFDGWYTDNTTFENKLEKITSATTGNLELYAKWSAVDYTISKAAASGGSITVKESANINEIVTITVNPDTGYELTSLTVTGDGVDYSIGNGLTKTSGTTYTFTMPAKNVTVTAVFSKIKYDVTFKVEGVDTVVEVEHGDTAASKAPQSPTKTGNYHFVGWVKGTDTEQEIVTVWDAIRTDGVVYTAKFEENAPDKYTVTFIAGEGGTLLGSASTEVTQGSSLTDEQIPAASKTGYTFTKWSDGECEYTVSELKELAINKAMTLTAVYNIKKYTVTYKIDGEDDIVVNDVEYNTAPTGAPTLIDTETRHYLGWVKGDDVTAQIVDIADERVTDNTIYTAKYETITPQPKMVIVTFDAGEDGTMLGNKTKTLAKGGKLVVGDIPTASKTGYDFVGWHDGNKTYTVEELLNEVFDTDTTLTAQYAIKQFTVTFDKNGADSEDVASQTVDYNEKAEKPTNPTKDGYTFTGWTIDGNSFSFETPITEDIGLVASWAEIETPKTALELLSGFADWMKIDIADGTESIVFTASTKDNTAFTETDKFAVYVAEYTENGVLESVNKVDFAEGDNNTITAVIAAPDSNDYKIFIWTDKYEPVIKPITQKSDIPDTVGNSVTLSAEDFDSDKSSYNKLYFYNGDGYLVKYSVDREFDVYINGTFSSGIFNDFDALIDYIDTHGSAKVTLAKKAIDGSTSAPPDYNLIVISDT